MKTQAKRLIAAAVLLTGLTAFAANIDDFLRDNKSLEIGGGAKQALAEIEKKIAAGGLSEADLGKCQLRKAEILFADKDTKMNGIPVVMDKIIAVKGVLPETKLEAAEALYKGIPTGFPYGDNAAYTRDMAVALQKLPEFQQKGDLRGRMLRIAADVNNARHFFDVACALYIESAENTSDQDKKIDMLFKAAAAALGYREIEKAEDLIKQIRAIPNISPAMEKRALLTQGLCLITVDQYDWQPPKERVARAEALINEAMKPHGHQILLTANQIFDAKAKLVQALNCSGDAAKAAKLGEETVASAEGKKVGGLPRGNLALLTGDIMVKTGDWKNAIRHYRIAEKCCSIGPKNINIKIAGVARANKDYKQAMDAYAEARNLCDHVEGKDEMAMLARLAGIMSNAIRNKTSFSSGDDVLGKSNDDLAGLELDE